MDKCETDTEAEFKLLKFKENQTYKKHRKLKWSLKSVAFNIISTKHVVNKRTMYVHEGLSGIYGWMESWCAFQGFQQLEESKEQFTFVTQFI